MRDFKAFGFDLSRTSKSAGKVMVLCPHCQHEHNNRKLTCGLSLDNGMFHCFRCGFKGRVPDDNEQLNRAMRQLRADWRTIRSQTRQPSFMPAFQKLTAEHACYLSSRGISREVAEDMGVRSLQHGGKWWIAFVYYLEHEYINYKGRSISKEFHQPTGTDKAPYNIDAIRYADTCIITEGEIDVLSYAAAGITTAISCPNGAAQSIGWLEPFIKDYIDNKQVIYLSLDDDAAGRKLRKVLIERLGAEHCRIITLGEGCKDANDHLRRYGADSLRTCVEHAPPMPVPHAIGVAECMADVRDIWQNGLRSGATAGWGEEFDTVCSFEPGRLMVVTGLPGSGKSEWLDELVMRLYLRHDWPVVYYSPENYPIGLHIKKLVTKLMGKAMAKASLTDEELERACALLNEGYTFISGEQDMTVPGLLSKAGELARRGKCRILVVDPYNRLNHNILRTETETQYVSRMLDQLLIFARKHKVMVFLVAHPRKMDTDDQGSTKIPTLYDIAGSAHFYNKCDYGVVIERKDGFRQVIAHVDKVRFGHLGHPEHVAFQYVKENGRYHLIRLHNGKPMEVKGLDIDMNEWAKGTLLDDEEKKNSEE